MQLSDIIFFIYKKNLGAILYYLPNTGKSCYQISCITCMPQLYTKVNVLQFGEKLDKTGLQTE